MFKQYPGLDNTKLAGIYKQHKKSYKTTSSKTDQRIDFITPLYIKCLKSFKFISDTKSLIAYENDNVLNVC